MTIHHYSPTAPANGKAVVIFPGGGYAVHADHEGSAYAEFLAAHGYHTFVAYYRVAPHRFPAPLLDAREAMRFARASAADCGFSPDKIAIMGSSAGGHLAALTSTYTAPLDGENATVDYRPNAQILCYPVICAPDGDISHEGSYQNLLGDNVDDAPAFDPSQLVTADTPPTFVWHTNADETVNVINSYRYAEALRRAGVSAELHVFPDGVHGLGLAFDDAHVGQWTALLLHWLEKYL